MINKNDIQTNIQLFLDEVELNISVKDDLTGYSENEPLYNFGYIQVSTGHINDEDCYHHLEFMEMEEYKTVSYRAKRQ